MKIRLDLLSPSLSLSLSLSLPALPFLPQNTFKCFTFHCKIINEENPKKSHPEAVVVASRSSNRPLLLLLLLESGAHHRAPPASPGVVALPVLVPDLAPRPPAG